MYAFIEDSEPRRLSQAYALHSTENTLEQAHVSGAYTRCCSATSLAFKLVSCTVDIRIESGKGVTSKVISSSAYDVNHLAKTAPRQRERYHAMYFP